MSMFSLSQLLSIAQQVRIQGSPMLDKVVTDPQLDERMHRILTQVTAAYVLRNLLEQVGVHVTSNSLDLLPLSRLALNIGLIGTREYELFESLNRRANEAKHKIVFRPRL